MEHIELYAMRPVNRTAGRVVSQRGCNTDSELTKSQLVDLKNLLLRKQRFIKLILKVRNKVHHRNIMWRINKGHINPENYNLPRILPEYKRVGEAIQIIDRELLRQRGVRRAIAIASASNAEGGE